MTTHFPSVDAFITHWASRCPERAAIISERAGESVTYASLNRLIDWLCWQHETVIDCDSICALYLDDSIVCHAWLHVLFRLGATVVPVDSELGELTQANLLAHCEPDLILIGNNNPQIGFASNHMGVRIEAFDPRLIAYDRALTVDRPFPRRAHLDGRAMIAYTSGTTSNSKGVVLTHRNLIAAYRSAHMHLGTPTVAACLLRMASLGTIGVHFFFPQYGGSTTVLLPRLTVANVKTIWESHLRYGIDFFYLVPSLLKLLNHLAPRPPAKLAGFAVCAGSHLPPAQQLLFQEKYDLPTRNIYGLTESSFAVFFGRLEGGWGTNDVGPACSLEARVIGDDGAELPDGEIGELRYRGEMVSSGYYRNPEATAQTFQDGWLATGDLVVRKDGYFTITGRKKDVIIRGGFNIHPKDIEEAIQVEPGVVNAFVIGAHSEVMSEKILAYVQVATEGELDRAAVIERVKQRVGSFRAPDRYLFSVEEVPVNHAGKVDRRLILPRFDEVELMMG